MATKKLKLEEFLTPKRTLELEREISGRLFSSKTEVRSYILQRNSINFQVWIINEFGTEEKPKGFENFINRLSNNDPIAVMKGIYGLIEDKTDFPTFETFKATLEDHKVSLDYLYLELMTIIREGLTNEHIKKKVILGISKIAITLICAGVLYMM